jgi:hypothetical protein
LRYADIFKVQRRGPADSSKAVLQVSNKLWQFFAITIPATILVLAAYQIWRRTREERLVSKGPDVGGDTLVDKVGTV